jgi:hypothetical protein
MRCLLLGKPRKHMLKESEEKNPSEAVGQDYDHKRQKFVSVKSNRGNEGLGTKHERGNNYNTN